MQSVVRGTPRQRHLVGMALAIVLAMLCAVIPAGSRDDGAVGHWVIRTLPGETEAGRSLVEHLGGVVTLDLSIIDGFAADLPERALTRLAASGLFSSITPDVPVALSSTMAGTAVASSSTCATTPVPAPT